MKILSTLLISFSFLAFSCGTPVAGIFDLKNPQEKYASKMEKTAEGRLWLAAAHQAVAQPYSVNLPYRQHGSFHSDKSRAMGIEFSAKRGERLFFEIEKNAVEELDLFADIIFSGREHNAAIIKADSSSLAFTFDVEESGDYVLRLQPQLHQAGEYAVAISRGPSLEYPVSGSKAKAGSFWGAARDGGKRKHEGIDIFASKGTPVVAAEDGMITSVKEGGIGGKTVWLRPAGRNISLYYAHLDQQLAEPGQMVKKGTIIGTVGNTGNARTTAPHLHFGVYGYGGATDPLPFIDRTFKAPAKLAKKELDQYLKLTKSHKTLNGAPLKANTLLVPLAVDAKGYIAELPDGQLVLAPFKLVKQVKAVDALALKAPAGTSSVN